MSTGYWDQVQAADFEVPADRPLDDLTAELTTMLGSTRPEVRDGTAYPALATWIDRGVYDDLLAGLGDGMVAGLSVGLGETGTDSVFRRSFSALIVAECLERDNEQHLRPRGEDPRLGRPDRGLVPHREGHPRLRRRQGLGARHRARRGRHRRAGGVAAHVARPSTRPCSTCSRERLVRQPADAPLASGEPDRMAHAAMRILRRGTLGTDVLEPWVHRIGAAGNPFRGPVDHDPFARDGGAAGVPARALRAPLPVAAAAGRPLRPAAGRHRGAPPDQRTLPTGAYQRVAGR